MVRRSTKAKAALATGAIMLAAPAILLACNALTGIGDVGVDERIDAAPEAARPNGSDAGPDPKPAPPPTCTCVAPAPADWTGPTALLESETAEGRTCPTGLSTRTKGGADLAPGPDCLPCACGNPTGACDSVTMKIFTGPGCNPNTPCLNDRIVTGACSTQTWCSTTGSGNANINKDAGVCPPSGGGLRPRTWGKSGTACGFTEPFNDCPATQACAPKSEGAPDAKVCVQRAGEHPCPLGSPYSVRKVYYDGLTDTRKCSACTCAPGTTTCSNAVVTVYSDDNCANAVDNFNSAGSCDSALAFGDLAGSAKITSAATVTGSCSPGGGTLTGTIAEGSPTTYCCLP